MLGARHQRTRHRLSGAEEHFTHNNRHAHEADDKTPSQMDVAPLYHFIILWMEHHFIISYFIVRMEYRFRMLISLGLDGIGWDNNEQVDDDDIDNNDGDVDVTLIRGFRP